MFHNLSIFEIRTLTAQPNEHAMFYTTIINKDSSAQNLQKMNLEPSITPRFTHFKCDHNFKSTNLIHLQLSNLNWDSDLNSDLFELRSS